MFKKLNVWYQGAIHFFDIYIRYEKEYTICFTQFKNMTFNIQLVNK